MFVQRSPWRALNALLIEWPSIGRVAAVPHEGRSDEAIEAKRSEANVSKNIVPKRAFLTLLEGPK